MNLFVVIGVILIILGIAVLLGAVPGGVVLGLVSLLVGLALAAWGSGRLST